jgi:hypothetical protein
MLKTSVPGKRFGSTDPAYDDKKPCFPSGWEKFLIVLKRLISRPSKLVIYEMDLVM